MSCHSCHTDGHTNNLLSDTLGDGSYGAPKRVPSLLGVATTGPWTWTGSIARLEDQIRKSIVTTMHGTKPTDEQVADLAAYLNSLTPPCLQQQSTSIPLMHLRLRVAGRYSAFANARVVMSAPEFTSPDRFDVGSPTKWEIANLTLLRSVA